MQKRKLGLIALVGLSVLGLASCGPEPTPTPEEHNGTVNVYLNYNGKNGVSYIKQENYPNPIDKATYTYGALLPTWQAFAKNVKIDIVDVADYQGKNDNATFELVEADGFKSSTGKGIDLFYNSVANIKKMANAGKAVNILPFVKEGKMPHFAAYLEENPEVLGMCVTYNDKGEAELYYTPYFDGYQQIERMFIMDTQMVERLLDVENAGDETAAIEATKRLAGAYYKPYMDSNYNYKDAETSIKALNDNDEVVTIKVPQVENIIKQQNASLANAGTTGKDLVAQLQAYLKAAYPSYAGKLSEIYTSAKAVYNPDDLVALMRVVRANPATASGVAECDEVKVLMPRGEAANRMENMLDFSMIWGVNGLDSESNNLFYDGAGKLNVHAAMEASYDSLTLLNQLYNEGLILKDFQLPGNKKGTAYIDRYWKSNTDNAGAGFMLYDYCASTTVGNDKDENGIGTPTADRKGVYKDKNFSKTGIRPVLAPVTYWNTSYEANGADRLFDTNGQAVNRDKKTLTRFYDSNRALKGNSWCIPSTHENLEGAIKLMDYLYSQEGSYINDFGPAAYQGEYSSDIIFGETVPTLSPKLIDMYLKSGTDFWSFMREYIGSTNGIGSVRSDALDMQVTNKHAQVGLANVQKAIKTGVCTLALCSEEHKWDSCVPTNWQVSENSSFKPNYKLVTDFWNAGSTGTTGWRAVVVAPIGTDLNTVVVSGSDTFKQVKDLRETYASQYLTVWSKAINATPSWVDALTNPTE